MNIRPYMHVLPTELHDVERKFIGRDGFMVNLCMILESAGRNAKSAKTQMLVWTSRRAFAFLRFAHFCQQIRESCIDSP